eukprot:TRINITY_DN1689_c0_g1_i2.p1 TRINITY_DN1689_c0_g1~~TRINITY_DN1689_c0_g1_i2.p1  ORF type:complete len:134 (-),score=21.34 TRINITY_DN1689_c0_g1_i2:648-1049(-)
MSSKRTKDRMDRDNGNYTEVKPLVRSKPGQISSSIFDTQSLKKYKAFFKLSKMNYQGKEQISAAVARHFAVHAVDEATVLVSFLDEVKRQQEYYFDSSHVAKTQGKAKAPLQLVVVEVVRGEVGLELHAPTAT